MEASIEDTRLICKFLELEEGFGHVTDQYGYHQCVESYLVADFVNPNRHINDDQNFCWLLEDMKFHTSFDWLVLVSEKIYHEHDVLIWTYEIDDCYNKIINKIKEINGSND